MSDTGSQQGLVPVAPQGQMEMVESTAGPGGPGQPPAPTYEQLLRFYSEQTRQPMQVDPRVLSYTDLHEYYKTFFDRPATPLPPMLPPPTIENTDTDVFLTEDEVVTKDEAREAFASV